MAPKYNAEKMKRKIHRKILSRFARDKLKKVSVSKLFKSIYKIPNQIAERNFSDLKYFYDVVQELSKDMAINLKVKPIKEVDPDDIQYEVVPSVDHKLFLTEIKSDPETCFPYWNVPGESEELSKIFSFGLDQFFINKNYKKNTSKAVFNWLRSGQQKKRTYDETDETYYNLFLQTLKKLSEEGKYIVTVKKPPTPANIYVRSEITLPAHENISDDESYELKKKKHHESEEEEEEKHVDEIEQLDGENDETQEMTD